MPPEEKTEEQQQAEVLAVINAGIDEADGKPAGSKPEGDAGGDGDGDAAAAAAAAAAGKDDGDGDGDAADGEGAGDGDGEGDGDGKPPEGDGKPAGDGKPGDGAGDGKAAADAAAAAAAAAAAGETPEQKRDRVAKEITAALDLEKNPLPKDTKEATQKRFKTVIDVNKHLTDQVAELTGQRDQLWQMVQSTGATPQEFGDHCELLRMTRSDDPKELEKALEQAQALAADIAKQLGRPLPGADPLEGFDDLKKDVQLGDISQKRAEELANMRRQQAAASARDVKTKDQRDFDTAVAKARDELNAVEADYIKTDPLYAAKKPYITPMIKAIARSTHPSKWAQAFKDAYTGFRLPAGAAPAAGRPAATRATNAAPRGTGQQQPHHGNKQPAGGGAKTEPKTLDEAIMRGIEEANAGR